MVGRVKLSIWALAELATPDAVKKRNAKSIVAYLRDILSYGSRSKNSNRLKQYVKFRGDFLKKNQFKASLNNRNIYLTTWILISR